MPQLLPTTILQNDVFFLNYTIIPLRPGMRLPAFYPIQEKKKSITISTTHTSGFDLY